MIVADGPALVLMFGGCLTNLQESRIALTLPVLFHMDDRMKAADSRGHTKSASFRVKEKVS